MQLQHVVRRANRANLIRAHNPNPTRNSQSHGSREPTYATSTYIHVDYTYGRYRYTVASWYTVRVWGGDIDTCRNYMYVYLPLG